MIADSLEVQTHLRNVLLSPSLQVLDESASHAGHTGNPSGSFGTHLRVKISRADAGKLSSSTRVAQHRLVYDACASFFERGLHALAIEMIE